MGKTNHSANAVLRCPLWLLPDVTVARKVVAHLYLWLPNEEHAAIARRLPVLPSYRRSLTHQLRCLPKVVDDRLLRELLMRDGEVSRAHQVHVLQKLERYSVTWILHLARLERCRGRSRAVGQCSVPSRRAVWKDPGRRGAAKTLVPIKEYTVSRTNDRLRNSQVALQNPRSAPPSKSFVRRKTSALDNCVFWCF